MPYRKHDYDSEKELKFVSAISLSEILKYSYSPRPIGKPRPVSFIAILVKSLSLVESPVQSKS
jgi:hypothetical protein